MIAFSSAYFFTKGFNGRLFTKIIILLLMSCIMLIPRVPHAQSPEAIANELLDLDIQHDHYFTLAPDPEELYPIFKMMSDYTDLQREAKLTELKGNVADWTLEVYEISRKGQYFRVHTTSDGKQVSCIIERLVAQDTKARNTIYQIKTGNKIHIRGVLTGDTTFRDIEIDPAVMVRYFQKTDKDEAVGKYIVEVNEASMYVPYLQMNDGSKIHFIGKSCLSYKNMDEYVNRCNGDNDRQCLKNNGINAVVKGKIFKFAYDWHYNSPSELYFDSNVKCKKK